MLTIGNRTRILQTLLKESFKFHCQVRRKETRDDIENIYYCSSCVYVTPFFFDKMHNALFPEQCNVTNEIDNLKSNFQVH